MCLDLLTIIGWGVLFLMLEGVCVFVGFMNPPKWHNIMAMGLAAPMVGASADQFGSWFSRLGSYKLPGLASLALLWVVIVAIGARSSWPLE